MRKKSYKMKMNLWRPDVNIERWNKEYGNSIS